MPSAKHSLIIFALLGLIVTGCRDNSTRFQIFNQTGLAITSLTVSSSPEHQGPSHPLPAGQSLLYHLDMNRAPQQDGEYTISCQIQNHTHSKTFGYYSNGTSLDEDPIQITILNKEEAIQFQITYSSKD